MFDHISFYRIPSKNYFYIEGSFVVVGGFLGLQKVKFDRFSFLYGVDIFFFLRPFSFSFFWNISDSLRYATSLIRLFFFGISVGFSRRFKFESRLYRTRFYGTVSYWQLAISEKIFYTSPMSLSVKESSKRNIYKYWWSVNGILKSEVFQHAFLYKSFRIPDMYSKLGIFIKDDPFEWRETIERIR